MALTTDQPKSIRPGEELDLPKLNAYLREHLEAYDGDLIVNQFPGGASNLTYLLTSGNSKLVLRRPPFGLKIKSAHDMSREYRVLSALDTTYSKSPKPLLFCDDESVIGAPFYIMERMEGVILRTADDVKLDKKIVYGIAESMMDTLAELHNLDYNAIGLGELGKPEGYAERQVTGWAMRYQKAKTNDFPALENTGKWLAENLPKAQKSSLIHNDFKHDNVILDQNDLTNIKAVLDWEMCTLGDPLLDFGTTLAYWTNADEPSLLSLVGRNPSCMRGNPSRAELLELYAGKSGLDPGNGVFYYAYGLFKLAVVLQQLHYRYKLGHTKDPRFEHMHKVVEMMGEIAYKAIQKNRIDQLF